MNKNGQLYYESALKLLLPVRLLPEIDGFEVRFGKKRYFFRGTQTPFNRVVGVGIASSKYCANKIWEKEGLPVPKATAIERAEFEEGLLEQMISDLRFPLVIKPIEGRLGGDVVCNIQTITELQQHLIKYFMVQSLVSIEEFHGHLNSYRVLCFRGKILDVVLRYPAHVIGDGQHTLKELIDKTNRDRQTVSEVLAPIRLGVESRTRMAELGINLYDTPAAGEVISLGYVTNATQGGTYRSLGKQVICRKNKRLIRQAAAALQLDLVGLDVLCENISQPIDDTRGVLLEANCGPSVRIHQEPMYPGVVPNLVTRRILRSLIFAHPWWYLYGLYAHRKTAPYIRSILMLAALTASYRYLVS